MHVCTGPGDEKYYAPTTTMQQQQRQQHQPQLTQKQQQIQQLISKHVKRIYITQSRRNKTEHIIYIHCKTQQACTEMRHKLTTHTTVTPTNTYNRYIVGKAYVIPSYISTSDIKKHIQHHVPQIATITITRVQQRYPSIHLFDHIYFSISTDQVQYLPLIPSFTHQPIRWERYTPPVVSLCSLLCT